MKLTYDSLGAQLRQKLLPVYLVSGDEPLLAGEAADAIRGRAREAGFSERETHFIERGSGWDGVRTSVNSLSLFAARRIVEVRLPSGKPGAEGGSTLTKLIDSHNPEVLLLILTGKLDRDAQSAQWVKAVEAHGAWVPVWPVAPDRLAAWLGERCRRLGLQAEPRALQMLADRTEGNLLAASQELEKLKLLASGDCLTEETVLASVADSARFNVFQLSEALSHRDAARALRVLGGLRAEGVEPPLVLWAVNKSMRDAQASRPSSAMAALSTRASRADRMSKGQMAGDAWSEIALLAAELCGRPALPPAVSMFK